MTDAATRPVRLAWLDPLVAGVIFAIALWRIAGWPRDAVDAADRVAFALPAAAIACSVGVAVGRRSAVVVAVFLATISCVAPVLWPMLTARPIDRWSPAQLAAVVGAIAMVAALAEHLASRIAADARGGPTLVALTLLGMSVAGAGLLGANGTLKVVQQAAPIAVVASMLAIVGGVRSQRAASPGVVGLLVATLAAELVVGWRWADLPGWQASTIAAAMPLAWAAFALPIVPRRMRWMRVALALFIAATLAIVAGVVAGREMQRTSTSTGADEYGE